MFTTHIKKLRKFDDSAITIVDIKGKIKYADDRYTEISGYTPHELIDNTFNIIRDVKSIISIAKQLKIETVAEFVSDEKTFNKVKELGIDYSQGYYIGKPRPIDW